MTTNSKTPETDGVEANAFIGLTSFSSAEVFAAYNFARQLEISRDKWRELAREFGLILRDNIPNLGPVSKLTVQESLAKLSTLETEQKEH